VLGAKTPCASIDAGIRDWDVLPGSRVPPLANDYNLAKSNPLAGLPGPVRRRT
jgi:hypothetical protein